VLSQERPPKPESQEEPPAPPRTVDTAVKDRQDWSARPLMVEVAVARAKAAGRGFNALCAGCAKSAQDAGLWRLVLLVCPELLPEPSASARG
jgi:hypothetical protein